MALDSRMIGPRESVLRWFVAFTVRFKRQNLSELSSPFLSSTKSLESQLSSSPTSSPGSIPNVDMLRSGSSGSEHLYEASDVIRRVLYSTRENVQLLHEVLRQVRNFESETLSKQGLQQYCNTPFFDVILGIMFTYFPPHIIILRIRFIV